METAKTLMEKAVSRTRRPVDLYMKREFSKRQYDGKTKFMYCPMCYSQIKRGGLDYKKELQPLWIYTFKCLYKIDADSGFVEYERFYKCEKCGNVRDMMSEDELIDGWLEVAGGTRFGKKIISLTDENELKNF